MEGNINLLVRTHSTSQTKSAFFIVLITIMTPVGAHYLKDGSDVMLSGRNSEYTLNKI